MSILEGLFSAIVVLGFLFWSYAKMKRTTVMELYNNMMNAILGEEHEDIGLNLGDKFKPRKLIKGMHIPRAKIRRSITEREHKWQRV